MKRTVNFDKTLIFLSFLLFVVGCVPMRGVDADGVLRGQWSRLDQNLFIYEDNDLALRFTVTDAPRFEWRFENRGSEVLQIDHRSLTIIRKSADREERFSVWGETKDLRINLPAIEVQPDAFVSLGYPVQFRSKLHPFRVDPSGSLVLHFEVEWPPFRRQTYQLQFPMAETNP